MTRLQLVSATTSTDKLAEIAAILGGRVELLPRPATLGAVVEDGATLEDNARLKAVAVCRATSMAAVADDTGLEVDALDGAPGVHSGRFAGDDADSEANVAKLLDALDTVAGPRRTARLRTVALVRRPDGSEVVAHGVVEGRIAVEPKGTNGFGYDPVFVPTEGDGRSFAELSADEKHRLSHRGRAFRTLADLLGA